MVGEVSPVPGITTRTAYEFGGKSYSNEVDALRAMLTDAVGNAGVAMNVLANCDKVLPIVSRMVEITKGL